MREKREEEEQKKEAKEKYIQKGNSNDLKNWKMLLSLRLLSSSSLRARFSYFLFRALHSSSSHFIFRAPLFVCRARRYMWQQEKLMKHLPMVVEWNEPQKLFLLWASTYIRPDRERCVLFWKKEKSENGWQGIFCVGLCVRPALRRRRLTKMKHYQLSLIAKKKSENFVQYQTVVKSTQLVLAFAVDVRVYRA